MHAHSFHEHELEQELADGVRSAVRFPLHLPIRVIANGEEYPAESENFSSSGVLLCLAKTIEPGTNVEFLVEIPAGILGMQNSAAIHCIGRVLRSFENAGSAYAAVVIDEYRFQ